MAIYVKLTRLGFRPRLRVAQRAMLNATATTITTPFVMLQKCIFFILLSFLCCSIVYLEFDGLSSGSIYLSVLKSYNLPGILPLNIVKLAYLQDM